METKTLSKKFLNLFGLDTLVVTEGLFVFSLLPEKDEDVTDALVFLLLTDVNGVSVFVTLAVTLLGLFVKAVFDTLVVTLLGLLLRFVPLGFTDTLVPGCVCFNISFDVLISPGLGLKTVFLGLF